MLAGPAPAWWTTAASQHRLPGPGSNFGTDLQSERSYNPGRRGNKARSKVANLMSP